MSILDALRKSIDVSKALSLSKHDDYRPITHHEALYMATLGGAKGDNRQSGSYCLNYYNIIRMRVNGVLFVFYAVLSLDDKIGNFVVCKIYMIQSIVLEIDA